MTYKKRIYIIFVVLIVICIIPLLFLSLYNNPTNDDYTYAIRNQDTNLLTTILNTYKHWSGRYFATAISEINPLIYNSLTAYKIYPIFIILAFSFSFFYLINTLYKKYFSKITIISLSSLLILTYLVKSPSIVESFYWFSGYITYTIPIITNLILLAYLTKKRNIFNFIINSILIFITVGSNEISAIIVFTILLYINIESYKNKEINKYYLYLLIISILCIAIVILSPGNFLRISVQNSSYNTNIIWTLIISTLQTIISFFAWGPILLLISIIYTYLWGIKISHYNINIFNTKLKTFFIFFVSTLFLTHIPPSFGIGSVVIGRIANVVFVFFIISWIYMTQLFINKYKKNIISIENNLYYKYIIISAIFIFVFNNIFDINNNIATSYVDLVTGKAKNYNEQLKKRYQLINNNNSNEYSIKLPSLKNPPKTIYFKDISEDIHFWANIDCKNYWKCKPYIYLEKEEENLNSNFETLKQFGKKIRSKKFNKK